MNIGAPGMAYSMAGGCGGYPGGGGPWGYMPGSYRWARRRTQQSGMKDFIREAEATCGRGGMENAMFIAPPHVPSTNISHGKDEQQPKQGARFQAHRCPQPQKQKKIPST